MLELSHDLLGKWPDNNFVVPVCVGRFEAGDGFTWLLESIRLQVEDLLLQLGVQIVIQQAKFCGNNVVEKTVNVGPAGFIGLIGKANDVLLLLGETIGEHPMHDLLLEDLAGWRKRNGNFLEVSKGVVFRNERIFIGRDDRHDAVLAIDDADLDWYLEMKKIPKRNQVLVERNCSTAEKPKTMTFAEGINVAEGAKRKAR